MFPMIYLEIQKDTARILVYPGGIPVNLAQVKENFSKFLVKDYVKSAKGSGFLDFFDNSVTQEEFDRAMTVFYRWIFFGRLDNVSGSKIKISYFGAILICRLTKSGIYGIINKIIMLKNKNRRVFHHHEVLTGKISHS